MARDHLNKNKIKDNSRKTGWAAEKKAAKRKEAEARNAKYQALSLDEKLARNSTKVKNKLLSKEQ
jgi:hypothetical protein